MRALNAALAAALVGKLSRIFGGAPLPMIAAFNGTMFYGTAALVVLAFTLRYLALPWTAIAHARAAVDRAREEGLLVGLIRPITLWPVDAYRRAPM